MFVFSTVENDPSRKYANLGGFSDWHRVCNIFSMMQGMNTKFFLLTAALLGASLSGCGPNLVSDSRDSNASGMTSYYYGSNTDTNYSCNSSANIVPTDDAGSDGTQHYIACANHTSSTKIKLIGHSSASQYICAYPVQFINPTQFMYKLDSSGQPLTQCYDGWTSADTGVELDFTNINYNGVLVVNQSQRAQMNLCLQTGQNCPFHAIGQFR